MATITTAEATNQLRFVQRHFSDGKHLETHSIKVLQQAWHILSRDGELVRGEVEWRDIPLVHE